MRAIEFQTRVTGGSIMIPEEHQDKFKGNVRVMPGEFPAEGSTDEFDMVEHLLANPLNIEGFQPFTREEIYEQ